MASAKDNCGAWCATNVLEDGTLVAVPITCRSWDCPSCAQFLRRRLLRRLQNCSPNLFATLTTSKRTAASPLEAFYVANKAISELIKRWRRKFPKDQVEYFLVWESTKAGWPHAHLLLRAPPVSKHWLSHTWNALTASYVVDLQKVGSQQHAARYLSKYLAKEPAVPAGFRRWRRSAKFFSASAETPPRRLATTRKWERQPRSMSSQALLFFNAGLALSQDLTGIIYARIDPQKHLAQIATLLPNRLDKQVPWYERQFIPPYRGPAYPPSDAPPSPVHISGG